MPAILQALGLEWHDPSVRILSIIHDWSGIIFGIFAIIHIVIGLESFYSYVQKKKLIIFLSE